MTSLLGNVAKNDICALRVGERTYGIVAAEVLKVVSFPRLATLPRSPKLLLGIADIQVEQDQGTERRRILVPVVDVRPALDGDPISTRNSTIEDWKYAVVTRVALDDGAVLAIAAHDVWAASAIEDDDVFEPLQLDGSATAGKLDTGRIEGAAVEILDATAVAKTLRFGAIG